MITEEEYQIIDLVVVIFQNVGIKRCIDKIDILKNYQIYFEICKVIFPQTMIELLRFSEGSLTNAEKIQGVIDIVGKILQNDLYHISGEAIAEGKLPHIRNFLHILELLSENVHKGNRNEEEVQSAPENTRSLSDYDQDGHYTVIGIDRQFERQYEDEDGVQKNADEEEDVTKRDYQKQRGKHQNEGYSRSDEEDSQSQGPMNPILDKKHQSQKKKSRRKIKPYSGKPVEKIQIKQVKPKQFKKSVKRQRNDKVTKAAIQNFVKKNDQSEQPRRRLKSSFIKKINDTIQNMQANQIRDLKQQHNEWMIDHQIKSSQKENQINDQNRQRMQLANELILQRKRNINSLRNGKQAVNVMSNLFEQQRNIWKGMKKAKQQSQLEQIQSIIRGNYTQWPVTKKTRTAVNLQSSSQKRR